MTENNPKFNDKPHNEVTVGLHELFSAGDREARLLQEAKMELLEKHPEYDGLHVILRNSPHFRHEYSHKIDSFIQVQCMGHIHNVADLSNETDEQIRHGYKLALHESAYRIFEFVQKIGHKFNIKRYTSKLISREMGQTEEVEKPVTIYVNYNLPTGSIVVSPDVEMHLAKNISPGSVVCIPFLRYERE